jgi:hypothetical protein
MRGALVHYSAEVKVQPATMRVMPEVSHKKASIVELPDIPGMPPADLDNHPENGSCPPQTVPSSSFSERFSAVKYWKIQRSITNHL